MDEPRVTLRVDDPWDSARLRELGAGDSHPGAFLVAEVGGRIVAAVPLAGGRALVDRRAPTAAVVRLLEVRAAQLRPGRRRRRRTLMPGMWRREHPAAM
jgi:hypothetical protein